MAYDKPVTTVEQVKAICDRLEINPGAAPMPTGGSTLKGAKKGKGKNNPCPKGKK